MCLRTNRVIITSNSNLLISSQEWLIIYLWLNVVLFEGILFHKFLPVKRFTIVGIVTSVCRREKVMYLKGLLALFSIFVFQLSIILILLSVDDGTASIQCVFFLEYCNREHINEHKWTGCSFVQPQFSPLLVCCTT